MTATPSVRRSRPLPELEMEVMKILWSSEAATVAEVQEQLKPSRPLAYTTVMTVLDRLTRKHVAARRKQGRGYVYRPTWSREDACELAIDRLLADFFRNDPDRLSSYLRRYHHPEPERLTRPAGSFVAAQPMDSALL
jgi:predicted transcriptional regulator